MTQLFDGAYNILYVDIFVFIFYLSFKSFPKNVQLYTAVHCTLLYTVHCCTLYTALHCTLLYTVHCCTLYTTIHCTLQYTVHCCTHYTVHCCTHYTVHCCTQYTVHCILHTDRVKERKIVLVIMYT